MCYSVKEKVVKSEKTFCVDVWGRVIYPDYQFGFLSSSQCGCDSKGLLLVFAPGNLVIFCTVVLLELHLHAVHAAVCQPVTCTTGEE